MSGEVVRKSSAGSTSLSAKWQLDAALLSRPVDLTTLVSMSRTAPDKFVEDDTVHRLIKLLLNEKNKMKSDKDTKLDVLHILANVAGGSKKSVAEVRVALGGISEWFDEYIATEESDPGEEPELHKAMVLLLARCWDYRLKTEDVLELTQGNRRVALCTVVGILEDGETYSTELKQRQSPGAGKMAQWEHELVCRRYEKPLLLQTCRLLRGFTHSGTYFEASLEELSLYSVEKFAIEMDGLLDITLRSRLVEKLAMALYDCLFQSSEDTKGTNVTGSAGPLSTLDADNRTASQRSRNEDKQEQMILEESDHMAVMSVHAFLQNLYFYASESSEEFRRHMLVETLLIPRLVLPYLDRCVLHATILNSRAEAYGDMLEGDVIAEMTMHNPQLVKGIAASLRTLIIASFRAPATQLVMALLNKLNPTAQMLRARSFCKHHEYIFALLCLLNVNMGALDLARSNNTDPTVTKSASEGLHANALLQGLSTVFQSMEAYTRTRVIKRVMCSGALPISRDTPSYAAVMSILNGGEAGQLEYSINKEKDKDKEKDKINELEISNKSDVDIAVRQEEIWDSRAEAKNDIRDRMAQLSVKGLSSESEDVHMQESTTHTTHTSNSQTERSTHNTFVDAKSVVQEPRQDKKKGFERNVERERDEKNSMTNHLSDLPSLSGENIGTHHERAKAREKTDNDIKVLLSLALPSGGLIKGSGILDRSDPSSVTKNKKQEIDRSIPKEFLCSINNHVMKDPVRPTTIGSEGVVYERATIELWLASKGSVCPITGNPLRAKDLEGVKDLKNRIKRYHIQQTALRTARQPDDDLYDF